MRVLLRLRSAVLARRGAPRTHATTTGARIASRTLRLGAQSSSAAPLDLHHHRSNNRNARSYSVTSKFPTQDESAILAHADDEHDPNISQLVCGSCNTSISQTKDLIFFKWYVRTHCHAQSTAMTADTPLSLGLAMRMTA